MIARTAFVQLKNSYSLLFDTVLGVIVLYPMPPMSVLVGAWLADARKFFSGFLAWICIIYLYLPTVGLYRAPHWPAVLLPVAAVFYMAMTLDSTWRNWRGFGLDGKGAPMGHHRRNRNGRLGNDDIG